VTGSPQLLVCTLLTFSVIVAGCAGPSPWEGPTDPHALAYYAGRPGSPPPNVPGTELAGRQFPAGPALAQVPQRPPVPLVRQAPADPFHLVSAAQPDGNELHLAAARQYHQQRNLLAAEAAYAHALRNDPTNLEALSGCGRMLDRQGRLAEALGVYQQAIAVHPESASAHNDLGICLARRQEFAASLEALAVAVRLDPQSKRYRNNIAKVLVELEQLDAAFKYQSAAHGESVAYYNVGFLLYERGNLPFASKHFEMALAKDSGMEAARQMLALVEQEIRDEQIMPPESVASAGESLVQNLPPTHPVRPLPLVSQRVMSQPVASGFLPQNVGPPTMPVMVPAHPPIANRYPALPSSGMAPSFQGGSLMHLPPVNHR